MNSALPATDPGGFRIIGGTPWKLLQIWKTICPLEVSCHMTQAAGENDFTDSKTLILLIYISHRFVNCQIGCKGYHIPKENAIQSHEI